MHPRIGELLAYLEAQRTVLWGAVGLIPEPLRDRRPDPDVWSVAEVLERDFYRPLMPGNGSLYMDQLPFTPADHDPQATNAATFNPTTMSS